MKTVLLTGASGFVGRTTIRHLLRAGFSVHAVASREIQAEVSDFFCHDVDLLDVRRTAELVRSVKASHLLHFAWYVEHGKFWDARENHAWARASADLFQNFIAAGGRRIVGAGTCAEYDWRSGEEVYSELNSTVLPRTVYGEAKHATHLALQECAGQYDVSYAWGRLFFLFGLSEPPGRFIPSVIRSLLQNDEAKCSHGNQLRDFMFVEDAGKAFVKLLDSDVSGPVNIASGVPIRMKDVAETIAEIIGRPELLRLGGLQPAMDEPKTIVADTTRLWSEVNFELQTDFRAALIRTINWWKRAL